MKVRPHQLAPEGLPDGDYSVHIERGVISWVAVEAPAPDDLLTTIIAGVPSLVWDGDGELVYAEAP